MMKGNRIVLIFLSVCLLFPGFLMPILSEASSLGKAFRIEETNAEYDTLEAALNAVSNGQTCLCSETEEWAGEGFILRK